MAGQLARTLEVVATAATARHKHAPRLPCQVVVVEPHRVRNAALCDEALDVGGLSPRAVANRPSVQLSECNSMSRDRVALAERAVRQSWATHDALEVKLWAVIR